jgi:hypothetical protein
VFMGICIYRYYEQQSELSLRQMIAERKTYDYSFYELWQQSNLTVARNFLVKEFLKTNDDFFFSFDTDIVINTRNALDLLVMDNKPINGAGYIFKQMPVKPAYEAFNNSDYDLRNRTDTFEVKHISGGFSLYQREVIEKLYKKYDGYPFATYRKGEQYLSEDWSICDRARCDFGFKTYCNPNIMLGHLGLYPYSMFDYYALYLDNPQNAEKLRKAGKL